VKSMDKYELKRGGFRIVLLVALETLKTRLLKAMFFPIIFTLSLIDIVIGTLAYYLMAIFVEGGMNRYISAYGITYPEYLLVAIIGDILAGLFLYSFYEAIGMGYWGCETDLYITSPVGLKGMIMGSLLTSLVWNTLAVFTLLSFAAILGIPLHLENLPQVLEVLAIGLLPFLGLGLISASTFTLMNAKQGSPITWAINIAQRILSGYYFPVQLLPGFIRPLSYILPHTYFYEALRLAVSKGIWLHSYYHLLHPLLIQIAILLPLGVVLFKYSLIKAEKTGDLSRWT